MNYAAGLEFDYKGMEQVLANILWCRNCYKDWIQID